MLTASSTYALSAAVRDILPLKVHLADDGSRTAGSDTSIGSDRDQSDTDEDLASEPWSAGPIDIPPGLGLDVGAIAPAKRTPLRSQATLYSPLRSQAEAFVPKGLAPGGSTSPKEDAKTTVMMCNLPFSYTCDLLIDLLESKGFSKCFDFVYVPINFTEMLGIGYAFVNLTTVEKAEEFRLAFEGFDGWASSFSKTSCAIRWSNCQGLSENISRYRNSPMMSENVPAFYKPVLLEDGVRIPFPKPTKQLGTLRRRKGHGMPHAAHALACDLPRPDGGL